MDYFQPFKYRTCPVTGSPLYVDLIEGPAVAVVVAAAAVVVEFAGCSTAPRGGMGSVGSDRPGVRQHFAGWHCCSTAVMVVAVGPVEDWPADAE